MKNIYWREKRITQYPKVVLVIVLFSGLALRIYGINFGLPYLYDPDEPRFVRTAFTMLVHQDPNPHWFGHPGSTTIYMLSMLYASTFGVGLSLGVFENMGDFTALYFQNPAVLHLSGRVMIAFFGLAAIPLIYVIARRIFNPSTGLLAATFLALSPLHVAYSKLIRPDIQFTFLLLVAFWFCLEILKRRTWSSYMLAGFSAGLAAATKYPAVMIAPVIVMAHMLSGSRQWTHVSKLLVSGIASFVGVFVASPFLFLDFKAALANIANEARPTHLSATGEGLIPNLTWYIGGPLLEAISMLGLFMSGVGIIFCLMSKQRDKWLLIIFPLSFLLFIASLNLRWERWIIPVVPFLCVLTAHSLYRTATWIGEHCNPRLGFLTGFLLLSGIAAILLKTDVLEGRELSGADTRTLAQTWMAENIPTGSRILVEAYTPQFFGEWYKFFQVTSGGQMIEVDAKKVNGGIDRALFIPGGQIGRLKHTDAIREQNVEYMVLSNWYDRYVAESRRYAEIVATYERLINMSTQIYEIKRIPGENRGPTLRIYRFSSVYSDD